MRIADNWWRPLVLGLTAVAFLAPRAGAESLSVADRIVQCNGCHGQVGNSTIPKTPSLAGQPAFFILNQLFLMREGVRKVESMTAVVKDLKDSDLNALAAHFSKLPAGASDEPIDPELVKRGAAIAAQKRCISCHKPDLSGDQQIPRIAKQRVDYLIQALHEFRAASRSGADTIMSGSVAALSDADLVALAHYAASR